MPLVTTEARSRVSRRRVLAAITTAGISLGFASCSLGGLPPPSQSSTISQTPPSDSTPLRQDTAPDNSLARAATPTIAPPTSTPTPAPLTVEVWTARSDTPWLQALRQSSISLHQAHPNVTVDVAGGRGDFGGFVESFGAGLAPDVIEPGDLMPLAARVMVRSLDGYLAKGKVSAGNYPGAMWANGAWHAKQYGIPALDHGAELGLIWNTSLTSTATAPSSWDDLLVFGRQLTRRDGNGAIQLLGFDPLDGVGGLLDTARDVTGQDWFDPAANRIEVDNPAYRSFLDRIVSYYNAIGIEQLTAFRKTYRPLTSAEQSALDLGRQVAIVDGYWSVADVARFAHDPSWKFDFAWVPSLPAGSKVQRFGGRVLAIPAVSKNPDIGWELVEILSDDATNRTFCDSVGTFAMTNSFLASEGWRNRAGLQFYVDSIQQATRLASRSTNVVAGFAQTKWIQAVRQVLSGQKSTADALKAAQGAIQFEVDRVRGKRSA